MNLKIISLRKTIFAGKAKKLLLKDSLGSMAIYPHHKNMISVVVSCPLKWQNDNGEYEEYQIKGGVMEINNNEVTLLVE